VLDEMGADKLLGNGDMLYLSPGTSTMLRGQGTFLSDDEITRVVDFVGVESPQFAGELMQLKTKDELEAAAASGTGNFQSRDDLYDAAVDVVVRERRGSCSLLQRALGIGYGRAARLIDFMAEDGIVGQYNGSQARDVLISLEDWEARQQGGAPEVPAAAPAQKLAIAAGGGASKPRPLVTPADRITAANVPQTRRNRIVPEPDEPSDLEDEVEEVDEEEEQFDDEHEESDDAPWEEEESDDEYEEDESVADDEEEEGEEEEEETDESEDDFEEEDEESDVDDDGEEYDEDEWDEEDVEEEEEVPAAKATVPKPKMAQKPPNRSPR
jgi:S-DNA-T family DNA segregation ATPase FtsK/SpoIIIE